MYKTVFTFFCIVALYELSVGTRTYEIGFVAFVLIPPHKLWLWQAENGTKSMELDGDWGSAPCLSEVPGWVSAAESELHWAV